VGDDQTIAGREAPHSGAELHHLPHDLVAENGRLGRGRVDLQDIGAAEPAAAHSQQELAGAGRGRTILFPTLNLAPEQELLPRLGVYATESAVGGRLYSSVTNVGTRPTFNGAGVTVESHLFGFNENLTGGPMEVRFHMRIRDEQKFSGPDALRAQIARDIEAARKFFSERTLAGHFPRD